MRNSPRPLASTSSFRSPYSSSGKTNSYVFQSVSSSAEENTDNNLLFWDFASKNCEKAARPAFFHQGHRNTNRRLLLLDQTLSTF